MHTPLPRRQVAAVVAGNALEFYDFVTYAFFAAQIGRTFFPAATPAGSLLASLATFGVGFLTRPLGALVIGRMGDRVGRKPAMLLSFTLIGIAMAGIALTPSYAAIGPLAPVLVVGFRLLQGFALGGEVGPSASYLMEASPPLRRGFYISLWSMSADLAVMVAGLVGVGLSSVMSATTLDDWGWRVAFLIGVAILPLGLILRRSLVETLHKPEIAVAPSTGIARIVVLGIALLAAATTTNYVLEYMTTYAGQTLGMRATLAFGATAVLGLCSAAADVAGGTLSDRFGRKRAMIVPWCFLLAAVLPAFWAIAHFRNGAALFAATATLAVASCLSSSVVLVAITESLPRAARSGSLALIYAVAISIFGGSTQFIVTWLIAATGNPLAPAWYMGGAVLVGLVAMIAMPETAPAKA
ncbi:MFS transporter [Sphingosinicellaceae bacterium]|nr:MFS transporter [Sphingosinicellaceae bacterium]